MSVVASTAALLGAGPASADTAACDRVAAPGGSDSANGSEAAPFRSVRKLMASLSPGQAGCLREGLYEQDVELFEGGTENARVTLRPYPGEDAELKGRLLVGKGADYVTIEGLHLNGDNPDRVPSPIIGGDHVEFRNNDITNDHTSICFVVGSSTRADWGRPQHPVIDSNKIHDCGKLPANNHEHGIYVEATDHLRITNNWIYDNADRGVQLYPDAQNVLVEGNVIDGNGQGVIFSGDHGKRSNNNTVRGNVVTNSKIRHNIESYWPDGNPIGTGNVARANCVHGGAENNKLGGIQLAQIGFKALDNLAKDPAYVARGDKDFRLAADSPCRDLLAGNGAAVPGPDGTVSPVAPSSKLPKPGRCVLASSNGRPRVALRVASSRRASLKMKVRVRGGCKVGRRVLIMVRGRAGWRPFARASLRNGRAVVQRRMPRLSGTRIALSARVSGQRSRTVRVSPRG